MVSAYDRVDRFVLPDDTLVQAGNKLSRFRAYLRRVERLFQPFHNGPCMLLQLLHWIRHEAVTLRARKLEYALSSL